MPEIIFRHGEIKQMKKLLLVTAILLAILPLTACNADLVAVEEAETIIPVEEVTDAPVNDIEDENKMVCIIESYTLTIFTFQLENDKVVSTEVEVVFALRDFGLDATVMDSDSDEILDLLGVTGFYGEMSLSGVGYRYYLTLSDTEDRFNGQGLNEVLQEMESQDAFCS